MQGCENPTQDIVWEFDGDKFYNCPLKFIGNDAIEWYKEHSYYEMYVGTAPSYDKQSAWFIEATNLYKKIYNECIQAQAKDKSKNNNSELKDAFNV